MLSSRALLEVLQDRPQSLGAAGAVLGPGADAAIDILGGGITPAPEPDFKNNLLNIIAKANADGNLGYWADILESKNSDKLGTFAGPIVSDAAQLVGAGTKSVQDLSLNPLAKWSISHIPMVGRGIAKGIK